MDNCAREATGTSWPLHVRCPFSFGSGALSERWRCRVHPRTEGLTRKRRHARHMARGKRAATADVQQRSISHCTEWRTDSVPQRHKHPQGCLEGGGGGSKATSLAVQEQRARKAGHKGACEARPFMRHHAARGYAQSFNRGSRNTVTWQVRTQHAGLRRAGSRAHHSGRTEVYQRASAVAMGWQGTHLRKNGAL